MKALPLRTAAVKKQTVRVKRAARVSGKLYAWACEAALNGTAAPKCSAKTKLTQTAKLNLHAAWDMSIADAITYERDLQTICFATDDAREGRAAFKEKRQPAFKRR